MASTLNALNKRVQQPRSTTAENDQYIGMDGQVTVDSSRHELRLHDGRTAGGWRILNIKQMLALFLSKDSELGGIAFTDEATGVLTRIGVKQWVLRKFKSKNGMNVNPNDGLTGDFSVDLPDRLTNILPAGTDFDTIVETGFYQTSVDANNIPANLFNLTFGLVIVVAYGSQSCVQIAIGASPSDPRMYSRRKLNGTWYSWDQIGGLAGDDATLIAGVDDELRLWSADMLANYVKKMIATIVVPVVIGGGGTATGGIDGSVVPPVTTPTITYGPSNLYRANSTQLLVITAPMSNYDRFEILGSAQQGPPTGHNSGVDHASATASVWVEINGAWQQIATQNVVAPGAYDIANASVSAHFTRTATGIQITDGNWVPIGGAIAGTISGRIQVNVQKGNSGTRWHPAAVA